MKTLKFLLLFVLGATLFTACKKDNDTLPAVQVPAAELVGIFEGKYATGNNTPSVFYSFNLKDGGTMEELDNEGHIISTGTWSITGSTFRTTHHAVFPATSYFVAVGNYDQAAKKITGTWGYGSHESDGGKWYMTKK